MTVGVRFRRGGAEGGRGEDALVAGGGGAGGVALLAHGAGMERGGERWGPRGSAQGRGGGKRKAARVS